MFNPRFLYKLYLVFALGTVLWLFYYGIELNTGITEQQKKSLLVDRLDEINQHVTFFINDLTHYPNIPLGEINREVNTPLFREHIAESDWMQLKAFIDDFHDYTNANKARQHHYLISKIIRDQNHQLSGITNQLHVDFIISCILLLLTLLIFGISVFTHWYFRFKHQRKASISDAIKKNFNPHGRFTKEQQDAVDVISHEIRTHLNAIIGVTSILSEKNTDETLKQDIQLLTFASQSLKSMVENSIDLEELEAGNIELNFREIKLNNYLKNVVHSFIPNAVSNNVDLKLITDDQLPETVIGDPTRINQVLFNLINNAIKFSKDGIVEVIVKQLKRKNQHATIQFRVKDNGIGIKKGDRTKIFENYTQADMSLAKAYGGTGTGLSIIKKLLLLMDSNIQLISEPDKGSEFFFELNLEIQPPKKSEHTSVSEAQKRVLIVDDNRINLLILEKYLKELDIITDTALSGEDALHLFTQNQYDLVFMDIQMPDMDGVTATQLIRENHSKENVPVIGVSASPMETLQQRYKDKGFNTFLSKPIDRIEVIQTAINYL